MLFFIAPFVWMFAIPALFVLIILVRALFWLRSLGRAEPRETVDNQPFIEGEFIDDHIEKAETTADGEKRADY